MANLPKTLPLRLRQGVRDGFESPDSEVLKRFNAISDILGYPINNATDWTMLWEQLAPANPDPSNVVARVSKAMRTFCDVFLEMLNSPSSDELFDEFLDGLSNKRELLIAVRAGTPPTGQTPHVSWRAKEALMTLWLSPSAGPESDSILTQKIQKDLNAILQPQSNVPVAGIPQAAQVSGPGASFRPQTSRLPLINEIERPEELLRRPPYYLTVQQYGATQIVVQCSHQDSLELLEEYLKKWTRQNPDFVSDNDMVKFSTSQSAFGGSFTYEVLRITAHKTDSLTPMLVLAFVQNILGFRVVEDKSSGSSWQFTRTEPFA